MMRFASPYWFLLAIPIALRVGLWFYDRRRGEGSMVISSLSVVAARRSFVSRLAVMPLLLEVVGWLLLMTALARPQRVTSIVSDERFGIDIVIALDASGSMAAEDFRPRNRFTVAKELIARFVERRTDDRIGIVTFGVRAATRVPVTFDRDVAREILASAVIGENGDGTAIGQAIATSVNRLRKSVSRSRVIILVTDGVNNSGAIEPATAAALASKMKIKIYAVGVGSRGEVPIPVRAQNPITGQIETVYRMVRADLDETMLTEIARRSGGEYFRAVDEGTLESVLGKIDRLEKSSLGAPKIRSTEEHYFPLLAGGLTALLAAFAMGETRWMRLPA